MRVRRAHAAIEIALDDHELAVLDRGGALLVPESEHAWGGVIVVRDDRVCDRAREPAHHHRLRLPGAGLDACVRLGGGRLSPIFPDVPFSLVVEIDARAPAAGPVRVSPGATFERIDLRAPRSPAPPAPAPAPRVSLRAELALVGVALPILIPLAAVIGRLAWPRLGSLAGPGLATLALAWAGADVLRDRAARERRGYLGAWLAASTLGGTLAVGIAALGADGWRALADLEAWAIGGVLGLVSTIALLLFAARPRA